MLKFMGLGKIESVIIEPTLTGRPELAEERLEEAKQDLEKRAEGF